jgi:hypothetical protein
MIQPTPAGIIKMPITIVAIQSLIWVFRVMPCIPPDGSAGVLSSRYSNRAEPASHHR